MPINLRQSDPTLAQLEESVAFIRTKFPDFHAVIGIQLGTGSNELADHLDEKPAPISVPFAEIPHFPICTALGHTGDLIYGHYAGIPVICLKGRVHFYEGVPMYKTTYPIRVLAKLGVKTLVLTNAAGCMQLEWHLADIMIVSDHINLFGTNPLIGPNLDFFPPHSVRFPDMSNCYNSELRQIAKDSAAAVGLSNIMREGVYLAYSGPSFETEAEVKAFKVMGADAVGMSTIPEVIVARHSGIRCLAFSVMTDICEADAHPNGLEIIKVGQDSSASLLRILRQAMPALQTITTKFIEEDAKLEKH